MDFSRFIQNNGMQIAGVIAILVLLFIFVYRLEGFVILIEKTVGTVLQKLFSLLIEAFCLVFKIINALEIYVVLLIDALTGKATASGKIASLAIGVLSVASFYTTYNGMTVFVEQTTIAFLITLGIQAILLSTSLLINDNLNLNEQSKISGNVWILIWCGVCCVGCIVAYIISVLNLSYRLEKYVIHILYAVVIGAALMAIFKMVMCLIEANTTKHGTRIVLFAIYFAVLSVSSFFSYNSFVPIMYPDSIRNIDVFQKYKLGIISLLENVNNSVDDAYYEQVFNELSIELETVESDLEKYNAEEQLSSDEKKVYQLKNIFDKYIKLENALSACEKKHEGNKAAILAATEDIGYYVSKLLEEERKRYEEEKTPIDEAIKEMDKELKNKMNIDLNYIRDNMDAYQEIANEVSTTKKNINCSSEVKTVRKLLKQREWSKSDEVDFRKAVNKIEGAKLYLVENVGNVSTGNSIEDMTQVYCSYKNYKERYSEIYRQVLDSKITHDTYEKIQDMVYEFLASVPMTNYVFLDHSNNVIRTDEIRLSDFYSDAEVIKRNANPELSQIEKNIRTFVDNKLVGVLCALVAFLIDMMILFVGVILPQGIQIPNRTGNKYSDDEIRKILSNLFNKPIGR